MKSFQTGEELAAKNATEDFDGQEERIAGAEPATMVRGESAGGNDAVDVGMQEQVLSPGMQDADHTDFTSQMFRVGCDFQQGLSAGGEQQVMAMFHQLPNPKAPARGPTLTTLLC
jgi:hypothetical protein